MPKRCKYCGKDVLVPCKNLKKARTCPVAVVTASPEMQEILARIEKIIRPGRKDN